jgi:hypothetical protein
MKTAKSILPVAALVALTAFPAANAQELTCENVNFADSYLAVFGSIRYSCLEIVDRNGRPHAKLKGVVKRVMGDNLTLQFDRADGGGLTNQYTFSPPDGFVFTVDEDRKVVPARELTESTKLNVYVPVTAPLWP